MRKASTTTSSSSTSKTACCSKVGLKRGPWTPEEDELLSKYIKREGEGRWRTLPKRAGLLRCGKSCRLRWMNYLRPNVKRGHIAPDEEDLILRLHRLLGNRWSLIAGRIPGRTDNEIKNYWNTHLSKKLISQGIDPRTHKPLNPDTSFASDHQKASSSSKGANRIPSPSPNPNPSSTSSGGNLVEEETPNNASGYFDQYHQVGALNLHNDQEEEEDDINYCTDDVFSSFLNSLINEDVYANQIVQQQQQQQQQLNGTITPVIPVSDPATLISSAQAFSFGTNWENAIMSSTAVFSQNIDPRRFTDNAEKQF